MDITELDKNFAAAKVRKDGKNVLHFRARRLSFTAECMKRVSVLSVCRRK